MVYFTTGSDKSVYFGVFFFHWLEIEQIGKILIEVLNLNWVSKKKKTKKSQEVSLIFLWCQFYMFVMLEKLNKNDLLGCFINIVWFWTTKYFKICEYFNLIGFYHKYYLWKNPRLFDIKIVEKFLRGRAQFWLIDVKFYSIPWPLKLDSDWLISEKIKIS